MGLGLGAWPSRRLSQLKSKLRVWGLGFQGLGLGFQGFGFRALSCGLGVSGFWV